MGYLYENVVAQIIRASGRELYYHIWKKSSSTHWCKVDFLITAHNKVIPIEVKSSGIKKHESIDQFEQKYSKNVGERCHFLVESELNAVALYIVLSYDKSINNLTIKLVREKKI